MVIFCTNCGAKLDDEDNFCTNCGTKVVNSNTNEKYTSLQTTRDNREIKRAKKELKKICGGFRINKTYLNELKRHGIVNHYYRKEGFIDKEFASDSIKKQAEKEIESGQLKSGNVANRMNELILDYKNNLEKEKKIIEEVFESKDIQIKIKKNNIPESQLNSIKQNLQHTKIEAKDETSIKEEIRSNLMIQLEKEGEILEKNYLLENRVKYVENRIKNSYPHIKLTSFEKNHINDIKLHGDSNQIKDELNTIASNIINEHVQVGEYDFAGMLIEEGRFKSVGSVVTYPKPVTKESSKTSNVFLKIFDGKIKIVGSEIKPFFSLSTGRDMTIFFTNITSINYSNERFGEIYLDLNNQTRLTLRKYEKDEKYLKEFYNLLYKAWEKFKNEENSSINKNEISPADELMKYAELYEKGLLSEEEFNAMKKKLLDL